MTTRSRKRRSSKRRAIAKQLPLIDVPVTDAGADSAEDARSALAAAEAPDESPLSDDAGAQPGPATAHTQAPERDRTASEAPTSSPDPAKNFPAKDSATPAKDPIARAVAGGGRASLTGKQYRGLKVEQLRTLLAQKDNELREAKRDLATAAPIAAAATDETLAIACAETWSTVADLAAIAYGQTARLTGEQKKRLGDLWAPAIRPYLGEAVGHAPLIAALTATAGIGLEKYWTIKGEKDAAAAEAKARE